MKKETTNNLNFEINIKGNRNIKILQLTDFQPVDPFRQRYKQRLHGYPIREMSKEEKWLNLYYYIDT